MAEHDPQCALLRVLLTVDAQIICAVREDVDNDGHPLLMEPSEGMHN